MPGDALLAGQLITPLAVDALAAALAGQGIAAEARESSLHTGGRYLRVHADPADPADLTLERIEDDEYLARGYADVLEPLAAIAGRVSSALARLGIRHRLELYEDRFPIPVIYLHHQWPQEDAEPAR